MLRYIAVFAALICCNISAAFAAAERVVAVLADGSIQLSSTGKSAFANMLFVEPLRAQEWLTENALQREIEITIVGNDRYGRNRIESPLQAAMLRDGAALIYAKNGAIPVHWHHAEAAARSAKKGIWSNELLLRTPENAAVHIGGVHVIEGSITRIYESKKGTYLNFGEDWHSDFSITIPPKLRRSMKPMLQHLKAGSNIRVRGSIQEENGPMIILTNSQNLEIR